MTDTPVAEQSTVSSGRRGADTAFAYLSALLVLALLVQIFLAGFGVFDLNGTKLDDADSFDAHAALGHILGIVAVVMLILAIVARTSKLAIWGSLALVVFIEVVQSMLAGAGEDHAWVGGLHALDGGLILVFALWLHLSSRRRISGRIG
jgi:Mn2+/Fe2+ NRAMP family transporter